MPETMRVLARMEQGRRQVAVLVQGRLLEYVQEEGPAASLVGSVVLGLVERVLPQVGAAFVKIGQPLNGFLPLGEQESFAASGNAKALVTGQEVLVQIKKDPVGDKGAFLTRDIALPGQYLLLMPRNRHVGVSSRVREEEEREKAQALGKALAGDTLGVIVRQATLTAREADIRAEWEGLQALWADIQGKAACQKPPAVLCQEPSALHGILRDYAARYAVLLESDAPDILAGPFAPEGVELQPRSPVEMDALWQGLHVQRQLEEALARKVALPGGGSLVIDQREALTTLDVNSGSFTGEGAGPGGQSLALQQNLAACPEIARHIRLRNLSGILLVDFIDMKTLEEQEKVLEALGQALADDRIKTVLHGFTRLGLLEMTRKRTRDSLSQTLSHARPHTERRKDPPA